MPHAAAVSEGHVTRIVLDGMGSDDHPTPEIEAALECVRRWGDPILMTGPRTVLVPLLQKAAGDTSGVMVVDAPEVLEMTDHPAEAARKKAVNSMAVGMDLVKQAEADAFVTAGNTGGAMASALFRLGRARGVKRPALTPLFPVRGGECAVLDIGANTDCRPEYLAQFAVMGSIYAEVVQGKKSPRVALLSNGEEAGKGNQLIKEAYPLIEQAGLNFIGNIEPKELYAGRADVAVTDGFVGNVFLKTSEAVARFLSELIRDHIQAGPLTAVGGLLARPAFRQVSRIMDPAEYGAVPLLGVDGLVFIGHGRSDARALVNAVKGARLAVERGLLPALKEAIQARLGTMGEVAR
jgi:glycerol-3-phosphate acyltransferase PlsX